MNTRTRMVLIASVAVCAALGAITPAGATTFCVPGFHAACPDNGTNVPQTDLETAMKTQGADGIPDRVIIDAVDYTQPTSIEAAGTDDLEIAGAGPGETSVSTTAAGTNFVVNLDWASAREVTMRDLKVVIPETIGANSVGISANGDTIENVDIESRRAATNGIAPAQGGTVVRDGAIYATGTGSLSYGIWVSPTAVEPGALTIERTSIRGANRGISVEEPGTPLHLRAVGIRDPGEYAIRADASNDVTIENSVIESGSVAPVYFFSNRPEKQTVDLTNVTVDSSTGDATEPAIYGTVQNVAGAGSIDIEVESSIIRGFDSTWQLSSPAGNPGVGDAYISLRHSNFLPSGSNAGNGTTFIAPGNTEGDPRFRGPGDYRLQAGSPAIDAGDPEAGLATDLLGQIRPLDGNDDGRSVIDQGAYEFVPPAKPQPVCETDPALCPAPPEIQDTTAPSVSRIKFLAPTKKKGGYLKFTLSEAATVRATLKPTPAGKGRNRRKTVKLAKKGAAGVNKVTIRKGRMKPGKYRLTIVATDAAGNSSGALAGKVRVRPAKR